MTRVCEICGKGRSLGNRIETRGKAKYLGGVGTKVTGITRRTFMPNLQNIRTTTASGTSKTIRVCTQCIRSGAVRKQVRNAPFKVTHDVEPTTVSKSVVPKQTVAKQARTSTKKVSTKKTSVKKAPAKSPVRK